MGRHVRGGLSARNLVRERYFYAEVKEDTLKRLQEPLPNLDDKGANCPLSEWYLGLNRSQKADVHKTIKHLASRGESGDSSQAFDVAMRLADKATMTKGVLTHVCKEVLSDIWCLDDIKKQAKRLLENMNHLGNYSFYTPGGR
jgi:hypothetical protein